MQKIKINSLKILSNPQKTANQFEFHEKVNLITAADNNFGKSTLAKLLMWAFGCGMTWLEIQSANKHGLGTEKIE